MTSILSWQAKNYALRILIYEREFAIDSNDSAGFCDFQQTSLLLDILRT